MLNCCVDLGITITQTDNIITQNFIEKQNKNNGEAKLPIAVVPWFLHC